MSALSIAAYGADPGAAMPEIADAMIRLLDAVTEANGRPCIKWEIGEMSWRCDVCGEQPGPDKPKDWTNDGRYDYCAACTTERAR